MAESDTTNTTSTIASHPIASGSLTKQPGIQIKTLVWDGSYEDLEDFVKSCIVGRKVPTLTGSSPAGWPSDGIVSAAEVVRLKGLRGRMSLTYTTLETCEVWGLEMMEIQKPIKTWMAGAEASKKPDLTLLANWEAQANNPALQAEYNAYKYNGTALEGNTLELAKMIREEGIEHYVVYTPVITCTTRLNEIPSGIGADNGKIATPISSEGVTISGLTGTASQWLKTGDRLTGAIDGTYTRVQQWTGADKWNAKLYETKATTQS